MFDFTAHRGRLVTRQMLIGLEEMNRAISAMNRRQAELEAMLERHREDDVATEIIPVEITGTEVRDDVEVHAWQEITSDDDPQDGGRSSEGLDENDDPDDYALAAKVHGGSRAILLRHRVAVLDGTDPLHEERHVLISSSRSFWGRITGSTLPSSGRPVWEYTIEEVERDDAEDNSWAAVADGLDGVTAYNSLESGNASGSAYGIPVAYQGGSFYVSCPDYDENLVFGPVPDDTVVRVWSEMVADKSVWTFSAPNPVSGCVECPEELNVGEEDEE